MRGGFAAVLLLSCAPAFADGVAASADAPDEPGKNLVYAELGGKAGLYGVGYERALVPWLSVGVAGSFIVLREQQIATVTPYAHATIVRGARNALFAELGPTVVHSKIPSPVPDWDGMSDSGAGGYASLGWERATKHLVMRTSGSVVVGEGRVAPWLGFAVGFR